MICAMDMNVCSFKNVLISDFRIKANVRDRKRVWT